MEAQKYYVWPILYILNREKSATKRGRKNQEEPAALLPKNSWYRMTSQTSLLP
jgi:hypothetical protein